MAEERSKVSQRMNTHWARVKTVAAVLCLDKMFIHKRWWKLTNHVNKENIALWQLIVDCGHVDHKDAVIKAKELLGEDKQIKLFGPEQAEQQVEPKEPPMLKALSLAMWYIKKIGCVETAEIAFNAALGAIKKVSK